jgi:hypothetical protein
LALSQVLSRETIIHGFGSVRSDQEKARSSVQAGSLWRGRMSERLPKGRNADVIGASISRRDDGIATGHTIVGRPNYWDEYAHGELDELEGGPGALIF